LEGSVKRPSTTEGEIDFNEGFRLRWSIEGLQIAATDYHAEVLVLPWEQLFDLADRAGYRRPHGREKTPGKEA
jgi:hypothetical protein